MLRAITIVILLVFLFPACKNAPGRTENPPAEVANTQYLKNTSLPVDTLLLKNKPAAVKIFYQNYKLHTVWTNASNRKALHKAIQQAGDDGLMPVDYNITTLLELENKKDITVSECIQYDLLLTESFRKLATHLFKGKLKPNTVYPDWALPAKSLNTVSLLTQALNDNAIDDALDRCRPQHATYKGLRESLAYLNNLPNDTALPKIEVAKAITLKDSGIVVANIKKRLAYWGDLDGLNANGYVFDRKTSRAVKKFQQRHGLYPNGIVDTRTARALSISLNDRKEQVVANLERWRWFVYDFGEKALIINIADYTMAVVEDNTDTIDIYKVIVGKPGRRTPVLYSVLNNLVLNPTWTVPPTILKEDLAPAASEDRSYFTAHNMKIFYARDTIETPAEEWNPQIADHYRYVQGPGQHNALGLVKFNFRNSFSVYLHDTNNRSLFTRQHRALSSGCVRVEDPFKLARYVLDKEDSGWTEQKVQELIALGETKNVGLKKKTYVHQLYWTAWMGTGGVQFRADIYNLDKILYKKLRQQS